MNSWSVLPWFLSTNFTCSPRLISTWLGSNSIFASSVSFMVTSMVLATGFFGSPGSPAAKDLWLWPGSPGAASASPVDSASAAAAPMRVDSANLHRLLLWIGSVWSVIVVAARRADGALAWVDGAELRRLHAAVG